MIASGEPKSSFSSHLAVLVHGLGHFFRALFHEPADVVAVHRGLEDLLDAGQLGGPAPHAVHLDVVGVAVAAVVVVDREHVGVDVAEDAASRSAAWSTSACQKQLGLSLVASPIIPESS